MHWYVNSMINAQEDWLSATPFPPLSVMGPLLDPMQFLNPARIGEIAYDVITLILYFNAIAEPSDKAEDATN